MKNNILKEITSNKFNTYLLCDKKIICIKKEDKNLYSIYIFNNKYDKFSNALYNSKDIINITNNLKLNNIEIILNQYKNIRYISKNKAHKIINSYLDLFFKTYWENAIDSEKLKRQLLIKSIVSILKYGKLNKEYKNINFYKRKKHQCKKLRKNDFYSKYIISENKNCNLVGLRIKEDSYKYLYIYINLPQKINEKISMHKLTLSSYLAIDEKVIEFDKVKSIIKKYLFNNIFN